MNRNYATQFSHIIPFENTIPYLYRYEEKRWIDEFFETGQIMLSSFKNYQKYHDNQLGDKEEGHSMNIVDGNNDKMIGTYTMVGYNEYCFCTSTVLISTKVPKPINIDELRDDKEPDKISFEKMMAAAAPSLTRHRFFLKHTNYQDQSEYRMLWSVDRAVENGVIISCPEARQFCEKIE